MGKPGLPAGLFVNRATVRRMAAVVPRPPHVHLFENQGEGAWRCVSCPQTQQGLVSGAICSPQGRFMVQL
jgi:hypothetical protein